MIAAKPRPGTLSVPAPLLPLFVYPHSMPGLAITLLSTKRDHLGPLHSIGVVKSRPWTSVHVGSWIARDCHILYLVIH